MDKRGLGGIDYLYGVPYEFVELTQSYRVELTPQACIEGGATRRFKGGSSSPCFIPRLASAFARNGDRGEEPTADRLESTPCLGLQSNDGCHGGHCSSAAPLSMVAGQTLLLPTLLTLWPFRTQPHRQSGLKGGRVGRWAWRRVRWIARRFGRVWRTARNHGSHQTNDSQRANKLPAAVPVE